MTWISHIRVLTHIMAKVRSRSAARFRILGLLMMAAALAGLPASAAMARGRSHSSHNNHRRHSNQSAAAKQRTIQAIQGQVNAAKEVLRTVESRGAMSQEQLAAAQKLMENAKEAAEAAEADERKCQGTLEEIEADIIEEQGPDSKIGKARAALDQVREHLEQVRESARESLADSTGSASVSAVALKATLDASDEHEQALRDLREAKQNFDQVRREVVEKNPKWVEASEAHKQAHRDSSNAEQNIQSGSRKAVPARRDLRTAQNVAAAARATIAAGEAKLRQLGAMNTGGGSHQAKRPSSPPRR